MRTLSLTAGLLFSLVLAAGCGKSPTAASAPVAGGGSAALAGAAPTAASASLPPCRLLTQAEVEAASGVKVGEIKDAEKSDAQTGKCAFLHADTKAFGTSAVASVAVFRPEKVASQKTVWTQFLKSTPVEGVGDFGYYNEAGSSLFAGKGDKAVVVQMLDGPAGPGRLAAAKTLAAEALARL
jgi:hypothetical protein